MNKKIYIADDETNIRLAIKTFLENAGFIVNDFENGDLLLAAFSEEPADLVILDVMMPGSNGFVVCKELRRISRIPIIMLTARDSDLDYATGLDLGSDDYLTKPFSPMALVMRVKAIFRRMEYDMQVYNERDPMTGIHNKTSGVRLIEDELNVNDNSIARWLFIIDIDNFKRVNDNLGHAFGDKIIIEYAEIISGFCREGDIICRFGSDEFIIFAKNIVEADSAAAKADELCRSLRKSYTQADRVCNLSASVGVACYPVHGLTYDELYSRADRALLAAKEAGKDCYLIYGEEKTGKSHEK